MKKIGLLDYKNYDKKFYTKIRKSSRGIIIRDSKVLMMHSKLGDYKFPGGGKKVFESSKDALIREILEETGRNVKPSSIKPFGYTEEIMALKNRNGIFKMYSEYYICDVNDDVVEPLKEDYEIDLGYKPTFVDIKYAFSENLKLDTDLYQWVKRDNLVLKLLLDME